jgi:hypothetical protein
MINQTFQEETATSVATLPEPALAVDDMPIMGPRGLLSYRNHTVYLSERNAVLAGVFVYHFGAELSDVELLERVWPDGATRHTLRWQLRRLERRLGRVGLTIFDTGYRSYALRPVQPV